MATLFLLVTLLVWLEYAFYQPALWALFVLAGFLYLLFRTRGWLWIGLFVLLSLGCRFQQSLEPKQPEPGVYTIVEVKANSAIGRREGAYVSFYNLEAAAPFDLVECTSFERIASLDNLNLFSYADMMAKKGVLYSSGEGIVTVSSDSLQARLYRRCARSPVLLELFWSIHPQESVFSALGLGLLSFLSLLRSLLEKLIPETWITPLLFVLACLYGFLFVFPLSLVRWLAFQATRTLFKDRRLALAVGLLAFLWLSPREGLAPALLFPVLLQLVSLYGPPRGKAWLRTPLLMALQLGLFHNVNFVSLLSFRLQRTFWGAYFGLGLFCLVSGSEPPAFSPALPQWEWHGSFDGLAWLIIFSLVIRLFAARTNRQRIYRSLLLGVYVLACPWLSPFFHVYQLNIGQGDCALVVEPFLRSAVLIDCGQSEVKDNVSDIIYPFLQSLHIDKLDAVVISHADFDHAGGLAPLQQLLPVKKVIRTSEEPVPVAYPFLHLLPERQAEDENENSLLSYFAYDGFGYLFMGDADVRVEKQLLKNVKELDVSVLKAGHHGSRTSSSREFLAWLQPELAMISVGENNVYGHPNGEVLDNLRQSGTDYVLTSKQGTIHLFSLGGRLYLQTSSGLLGKIEKNTPVD